MIQICQISTDIIIDLLVNDLPGIIIKSLKFSAIIGMEDIGYGLVDLLPAVPLPRMDDLVVSRFYLMSYGYFAFAPFFRAGFIHRIDELILAPQFIGTVVIQFPDFLFNGKQQPTGSDFKGCQVRFQTQNQRQSHAQSEHKIVEDLKRYEKEQDHSPFRGDRLHVRVAAEIEGLSII